MNFHISNTYTAEELDTAIRDGKKVYWCPDHDIIEYQVQDDKTIYEVLYKDPIHRMISDSIAAGAQLYRFYIEEEKD